VVVTLPLPGGARQTGPPLSVVRIVTVFSHMPLARSAAVMFATPSSRLDIIPASVRRLSSSIFPAYRAVYPAGTSRGSCTACQAT
jgi:hypothetical protein